MRSARTGTLWLLGWIVGLTAVLGGLLALGSAGGGWPPLQPERWQEWARGRDPLDVGVVVAQAVAVALVAYLLAVTLLQLLGALIGSGRGHARLQRLGPTFVATLTSAVLASGPSALAEEGASGAASAAASSASAAVVADHGRPDAAVSGPLIRPGMGAQMVRVSPSEEADLPWADQLGPVEDRSDRGDGPVPAPGRASGSTASPGAPAAAPDPAPAQLPPPTATAAEWVVRPGDHLWSIAQTVVTERNGEVPGDDATRDYWVRLIAENRDRLVDPTDPDLIVPGQRLVLPD